jgi:DNA-binding response OmpR family regulator
LIEIRFSRTLGEELSRGIVIFVEDEETLRKLGETILSRMGFEVSAHGDAESALEAIQSNNAIVLLATDMSLPGMNGVNLAHKIRAMGINAPILLMSGHDEEEINEAGGVPEPGLILQKPIGLAELRAVVDSLLS